MVTVGLTYCGFNSYSKKINYFHFLYYTDFNLETHDYNRFILLKVIKNTLNSYKKQDLIDLKTFIIKIVQTFKTRK